MTGCNRIISTIATDFAADGRIKIDFGRVTFERLCDICDICDNDVIGMVCVRIWTVTERESLRRSKQVTGAKRLILRPVLCFVFFLFIDG